MTVFAQHILQESYNKAGHEEPLTDLATPTNLSLVRHPMQQLTQVKTRV
jgi:hypothetical protein